MASTSVFNYSCMRSFSNWQKLLPPFYEHRTQMSGLNWIHNAVPSKNITILYGIIAIFLWQWRTLSLCNSLETSPIRFHIHHYGDVIMGAIASQITSLTVVYSTVYSDADQTKHQSSASLAFVRGNHRGPVNSPHKWPVTRKMFPFDDVIMCLSEDGHQLNISAHFVAAGNRNQNMKSEVPQEL